MFEENLIPPNMALVEFTYLDQESMDTILDLMDGDREMVTDLIDTHLEVMPALLTQFKSGMEAGNPQEVKEAAHAMKSSNAQFGALHFAQLCQTAENIAKGGSLDGMDDLYAEIRAEFEKVESALDSWKTHLNT